MVKELKAQVGEVAIGGVNATLTVGGQPNVLLVRCKEQAAFTEAKAVFMLGIVARLPWKTTSGRSWKTFSKSKAQRSLHRVPRA